MKLVRTFGRGAAATERLVAKLERRGTEGLDRVQPQVRRIVSDVRRHGDRALLSYRGKYDGLSKQQPLRIPTPVLQKAWSETPQEMKDALQRAVANIADFAYRQMPEEWEFAPVPGLRTAQRLRPLTSVGCYVPSGRHPLPSTLLMTVVTAHVAGVKNIVVVSPRPAPEVLAAAAMLGVEHVYQVGGAQGIAALAYGTESIPRMDKIVGPGNAYVTAAKRQVAFDCGIDMLAGPTEIVITSEAGNPAWLAADLVAQAEHDPEALAIFVTTQEALAKQVIHEAERQAARCPIAHRSLSSHGVAFVTASVAEARSLTNRLAPEHLTVDTNEDVEWVENAGSVFVGRWSAQPLGDYISGPNHTLPTGGVARTRGGLSVMDFLKIITVQEYGPEGITSLGPAAIQLAEAEGLSAHAAAIRIRSPHA